MAEDSIQVESDNFTLSGKMDGAEAVDMISELERFRSALLEIHDLPADAKDHRLDIYVVSDPEIYGVLGVDSNFVAIYAPTAAGPRALINGSEGVLDARSHSELRHSLRHEYVHHFTRTYLHLTEPQWLSEGLAEYFAGYIENSDGSYAFGAASEAQELILSYPVRGWMDMRDVFSSFGKIKSGRYPAHSRPSKWIERPDNISFFYAQSWALVHWAMNHNGGTPPQSGTQLLSPLVERLLVNDMPFSRDISHWPELEALRVDTPTMDEAIAEAVRTDLGVSLRTRETKAEDKANFETELAEYVKAGVPLFTTRPKANRLTASVRVKTLTPAHAAAVQYRQLSLAAGSRTQINPKMASLKMEIEAAITTDPSLARSLKISEAAQKYAIGATQVAIDIMNDIKKTGPLSPQEELLSLQIVFADFTNRYYQHPEALRDKLRPALRRLPDDISLLMMMAVTGLGDLREGGTAINPEAHSALDRLEAFNVSKTRPLATLPLVNLYASQDRTLDALYHLYHAQAFTPKNQFDLQQVTHQLEERLKEEALE